MSAALVLRETTFVAGPGGEVAKYAPPKRLTRDERVAAYRAGLRETSDALEQMGFRTMNWCDHSVTMQFKAYVFDFRIQRPECVVHVTSSRRTTSENPKSSIYSLASEMQSEFCLQMIISQEFSARPIYVDLPEDLPDPAKTIREAILGFLSSLNQRKHALGEATVGRHKQHDCGPKPLPPWIDI